MIATFVLFLREGLEAKGHVYSSRTDSETILHLYEERGLDFVNEIEGDFAIALWDAPRRRLLLVRDRLGVKPLYYSVTAAGVTFASEIKSILEDPDVPRDWSTDAVDAYLALTYVPCPHTIHGSSNGWTSVRPRSSASRAACACDAS